MMPWLDPALFAHASRGGFATVRHGLRLAADHTGVPAVVIAGVALVVSFRLAKKTARFFLEISVVVALLLVATHLRWITW